MFGRLVRGAGRYHFGRSAGIGGRWQIFRVSLRHGCRPFPWHDYCGRNRHSEVTRLKSMLEKVQKFLKKYVKEVTFFCGCWLPRLRLGPIMPEMWLELWNSHHLQHLPHPGGWKIRPTGPLGPRALQPLFPKCAAHSGSQAANQCVCHLDDR